MTLRISAAELSGAPEDGRYHRQELIGWWEQRRVQQARVLVIGAGALGNEILKLLALTGVGHVLVYDMDRIEHSNLNRSVLFRVGDEGKAKVDAATAEMQRLNPDVRAVGRAENVLLDAGLGVFAWADVVIGGVDNREARVFTNSACARVGRTWIDGAIEGLDGIVRVFDPDAGPCYECTMNATDRRLLAERRSCAMLAREAAALGHAPSTAVAASLVAALQVGEAIKWLHGQPTLVGQGLHITGLWSEISRVTYPQLEDCPGHERLGPLEPLGVASDGITIGELLDRAEAELGPGAVLDLSRDVVTRMVCPECDHRQPGRTVLGGVSEAQAACPECGAHRIVEFTGSIGRDAEDVDPAMTPRELGLPLFDAVVARQGLDAQRVWLFDGDAQAVLGPLASSWEPGRGEP